MSNHLATLRDSSAVAWVLVASFLLAMFIPVISSRDRVEALQILDRYIQMSDSSADAENDYLVSFQLPNGVTVGSMRVEFCNEDPLPGQPCNVSTTAGDSVPSLTAGTATTVASFAIADTAGDTTDNATGCTTATPTYLANYVDINCNATETTVVTETGPGTVTDKEYINFTLTNVDNPDNTTSGVNNDSFYARVYVFAATTAPVYAAGAPPTGAGTDYNAGLALSTAEQITIEARVQERLTFCVGIVSASDACAGVTGTLVDLGVLDGANVAEASSEGVAEGTGTAKVQTTTNASNGVSISFFGDDLKVTGATCGSGDIEATPSFVDQCLNYDSDPNAGTYTTMLGTREQWGVSVVDIAQRPGTVGNGDSGDTNALSVDAVYDDTSEGAGGTGTNFAFAGSLTSDVLATSTGVVSSEQLEIDVAAAASITTPTGLYTTTLTFVATSTF